MSTTDVREWAKAKGMTIGDHGRIPAKIQAAYDADQAPAPPSYDGGVTVADFPEPLDDPEPDEPRAGLAAVPALSPPSRETRPRRITTPRRPLRDRLRGSAKPKPKGGKAKLPRVSLAPLIEGIWSQLAFASAPIPPMQRLLQAQTPLAGIVLEDTLKDTAADRLMQPAARAEEKVKKVGGLIMPNVSLMAVLMTAPQPEQRGDQWVYPEPSMQHKAALVSLRWSLMLMAEAGSLDLERYVERAAVNAERGRQADQMMAWILGIDATPETVSDAVSAEDEAVERARAMFGDQQ